MEVQVLIMLEILVVVVEHRILEVLPDVVTETLLLEHLVTEEDLEIIIMLVVVVAGMVVDQVLLKQEQVVDLDLLVA